MGRERFSNVSCSTARLMCNDSVFRAPESFMESDLECGSDRFRVAMCRGPLLFIEKVNSFSKFTFSEKATKIDKIFTVNLTVCSNRQSIFVAFLENMNFTSIYLVQLIRTTNTNLEFLQRNFCFFTFCKVKFLIEIKTFSYVVSREKNH